MFETEQITRRCLMTLRGSGVPTMNTRHILWGGYVIASTRLVWVLEISLKLKI